MRNFLLKRKEEKKGTGLLKQTHQVQGFLAKNPCIHVSTTLILNPQMLVKVKLMDFFDPTTNLLEWKSGGG
jgi:hypothetical protein